jgi:hypothetical protein
VLTRAFGVPAVQTEVLRDVSGITAAYIYGSWAARQPTCVQWETSTCSSSATRTGISSTPPLALPSQAVQAAIRDHTWLESGSGAFHDTIACRTLLRLSLLDD